jgi:hypothetical protein
MMRWRWYFSTIAIVLLFGSSLALSAPAEVVNVELRPGATTRYLAIAPDGPPRAAVILLAGGNGVLRLSPSGSMGDLSLNFLISSRERFARQGLFVAALDAASDRQGGMDGAFRLSEQHARDIGRVVANVKSRAGAAPVWLVGNSAGTLSVVNAAWRLASAAQEMRPHGMVLTSAQTTLAAGLCGKTVYDAALREIREPVLIVSHQDDACPCGGSAAAARLLAALASTLVKEHKILTGGSPPTSDVCEAQAPHGFFGIEDSVVEFIADWIKAH